MLKSLIDFVDIFRFFVYNVYMKKLIVPQKYDNKKLNKFLKETVENLSDNLFYKTLRKKDIKVNGKRVSENITIYENDEILLYISDDLLESNFRLDLLKLKLLEVKV